MPNRDVRLELDPQVSLAPQSTTGAVTGTGVDLAVCDAALVIIDNGAATTPATVKIQESVDNSTFTDVADTDLIGTTGNPAGVLQTASSIAKISYIGTQRYIRVSTIAGGSAALISAEVVRAHLRHAGGVPV
jgi:hypothetical protein